MINIALFDEPATVAADFGYFERRCHFIFIYLFHQRVAEKIKHRDTG